jgi:threonine aldolase
VHVDGARIWNAAVATGESPSALIGGADTVMFCLSKGLGAPVGSLLCGSSDVIAEARRQRRRLGGGMRPGRRDRRGRGRRAGDDGRTARRRPRARRPPRGRARRPAGRAASIPATVRTNIVLRATREAARRTSSRASRRSGCGPARSTRARFRLVTHKDVDDDDIASVIKASISSPRPDESAGAHHPERVLAIYRASRRSRDLVRRHPSRAGPTRAPTSTS